MADRNKPQAPPSETPRPAPGGKAARPQASPSAAEPTVAPTRAAADKGARPRPAPPEEPILIVGIGASAGGLKALEAFFSRMPSDSGMSFVIIQHLDPSHKSIMSDLLERWTRMEVLTATDGVKVLPNKIYLKPPEKDIVIRKNRLRLVAPETAGGARLPIDTFFRSLAEERGDKAVCVILSGSGTDGTLGLRAIKGEGGLVIIQKEAEAEFKGMLTSAIGTGLPDFVLPVKGIADKLLQFAKHRETRLPEPEAAFPDTDHKDFGRILAEVRVRMGHDFSRYKKTTLVRRVQRRMALNQITDLSAYYRYLRTNPAELEELFRDLTINVTSFFRDPAAYELLREKFIPALLRKKPVNYPIRVWAPGSASGEEPYSIAIVFLEVMERMKRHFPVQVFATDINPASIEFGRQGVYPENIAADVSPRRLKRYFIKEDKKYRVDNKVRGMVIFAAHDLIKDPPFSRIDLIVCRNLLIYLEPDLQKKILPLFHYSLNRDGVLFLGSAEGIGDHSELFVPLDKRWKIYRKKETENQLYLDKTWMTTPVPREERRGGPGPERKEDEIHRLAERIMLEKFTPPGVLLDDTGQVLYFHGDVNRFLSIPEGTAGFEVARLLPRELREPVDAVIAEAARSRKPAFRAGLRVKSHPDVAIRAQVTPLFSGPGRSEMFLLTFEESTSPAPQAGAPRRGRGGAKRAEEEEISRIELQQRLRKTEQDLQATVEELETANEELRSANEELQANNEELQSLNEELESSKEELQSTNEELETVNEELLEKNDQLARFGEDIENLLRAVDVGTLFLDTDLRIRRFNPAATRYINLIPSDLGRSVSHLTSNLDYPDLVEDARQALDQLARKERQVRTQSDQWVQIRLSPHRTPDNVIRGVVVTFVDITPFKEAERQAVESKRFLEGLIDALPFPVLVLAEGLRVVCANKPFYDEFQTSPQMTERLPFYELRSQQWDNLAELRTALEGLFTGGGPIAGLELAGSQSPAGPIRVRAIAMPVADNGKKLILLIFHRPETGPGAARG